MNKTKIYDFLAKYLDEANIEQLFSNLQNKQRSNILSNQYFVKIGQNTDELFFKNLVKEINLYKNNTNCKFFPKLIDYYIEEDICSIVLERINGQVLNSNRNTYINDALSEDERLKILNEILNIKTIKIDDKLDCSYSRQDKLSKYMNKLIDILGSSDLNILEKYSNDIAQVKCDNVISHGDLIPPNIMRENNSIFFIDWEFIAIRPESYDIAYFLMFSKKENSLDVLKYTKFSSTFKKEVKKDAIILCLKEMNNWNKLHGKLDDALVDGNIKRWKKELLIILNGYEI